MHLIIVKFYGNSKFSARSDDEHIGNTKVNNQSFAAAMSSDGPESLNAATFVSVVSKSFYKFHPVMLPFRWTHHLTAFVLISFNIFVPFLTIQQYIFISIPFPFSNIYFVCSNISLIYISITTLHCAVLYSFSFAFVDWFSDPPPKSNWTH